MRTHRPGSPGAPRLVSVNVGRAVEVPWQRAPTAIAKRAVPGPVAAGPLGLDGDEVGDTVDHGGVHQALYAFAREDLDVWTERVGEPLEPGVFGENLTTSGIDVNESLVGERWRVGSTLLEVVSVRIPCRTFQVWLEGRGIDATGWVRRFTREGRPGPYLKVVRPGVVEAGDELVVEHRPAHGVTVTRLFRALTTDRELLAELVDLDALDPKLRDHARAQVSRATGTVSDARNSPETRVFPTHG